MSSTLVIADLHLCESRPDITQCFISFLEQNRAQHDALYILGDLFEAWIGDDDINPFTSLIAESIQQFSQTTPVYFCQGNRDFLLGKKYCKRAGMTLLADLTELNLYGHSVVMMHGAQLCIDDIDYQKFRKKSRSWWWQAFMLMLPLKKRREIAKNIRLKSKESQMQKAEDIMDVAQREVQNVVETTGCEWLIHGHTHRPNIHQLGNNKLRMVVGDWYEQGSVLELSKSGGELKQLPFNSTNNT